MTEPYSLAAEPWLPVATRSGKREFIRIRDLGREDLLRIDTGRADCDISLTEFLIGLLSISIGPSDTRQWRRLYETPPSAEEIEAAIKPFAHALVLDGDGPRFFQDYEALPTQIIEPVSALFMDAPAGHFVKKDSAFVLSRPGAAIALLTLQTSAPEGGRGHLTSLRGGGPGTTLVYPRKKKSLPTLWQFLWANVPDGLRLEAAQITKALPWLVPTRTSDGANITTPMDAHEAQAFFGMPRRMRLNFTAGNQRPCSLIGIVDDVVIETYITRPKGAKYPTEAWRHPLSPYYRETNTSNEWRPLHFRPGGIGYRDWVGLTLSDSAPLSRPADNIHAFKKRAKAVGLDLLKDQVGLFASGYAMKSMKPLDFTEAMLPLISTGDPNRDMHLAAYATAMVDGSGAAASLLLTALKVALYTDNKKGQPSSDTAPLAAARARFWADTENAFYNAIRDLAGKIDDDPGGAAQTDAKEVWRKTIRNAALTIFDDLAPIDAPDSPDIKNIVSARSLLVFAFEGRSKAAGPLWNALGLAMPVKKEKANGKGRKAA